MRASRRDIDPRLGLLDFSGYVDAAKIRSQGMQQLGQNIGEAIEGYKTEQENKKFRKSFAEELVADFGRKNADGTMDPSVARKLDFFNVNAGDFGDQNDEQKVETLVEALAGYDKSRLQTLRDGFALSELEHQQKMDQIRLEETAFLDAAKNRLNPDDIPEYTSTPSEAELEKLYKEGVRTILVNGKKMSITAPEEEGEPATRTKRGRLIKTSEPEVEPIVDPISSMPRLPKIRG